MGFLHGPMNLMRLRLDSGPSLTESDVRNGLTRFGFTEPLVKSYDVHSGWTLIESLEVPDFQDSSTFSFEGHWVFALRVDQVKVPSGPFKAEISKRIKVWLEERGMSRAPKSVRDDIRDQIRNEWVHTLLPHTKLVEVSISKASSQVYVQSASASVFDDLRKKFYQTFSRRLILVSPFEWCDAGDADALFSSAPSRFGGSSDDSNGGES